MTASVNLKELVVPRPAATTRRRTPWLTRYVLPASLLLGFVAVIGWSLRDALVAATPVTVVPVLATTSATVAADTPLFRAAGWIEPRPTPVYVSALVEGVVDKLLVVEGQAVEAGQPVATLVKRDAEIGIEQAEAELALRRAQLDSAAAELAAAKVYWEEPIERQAALLEAEVALAATQTQLSRIPATLDAAELKLDQSRKELVVKSKSQGNVAGIAVERARTDVALATATVEELKSHQQALQKEKTALQQRRDVLSRQLKLKVEEERRLKDAEAGHRAAAAQVRQADASLQTARLRLERMSVHAPISGHVLALIARPGSRLMGIDRAALTDASTIISLYDPRQLQVRADVRLENVPQVVIGQPVQIETPVVTRPLRGRVLAMTSLTDIQKNTLQVKIAIDEPPAILKPDMLVEATFLSLPSQEPLQPQGQTLRLMVPAALVDTVSQPPMVWVADIAAGRARRTTVQTGAKLADGMIEVTNGLRIGDRLIASGRELLTPNGRIKIRGEAQPAIADPAPQHHSTN